MKYRRLRLAQVGRCALFVACLLLGTITLSAGASAATAPTTPVGQQLQWLEGATADLPLSPAALAAHFDAGFLAKVTTPQLNAVFASLGSPGAMQLLSVHSSAPSALSGIVALGTTRYIVQISVDASGLIVGLMFQPDGSTASTWSAIDHQLTTIAPNVSLVAANVSARGTCTAVHSLHPNAERPLGSMFKLFVLGAVANAIHDHRVSWSQELTVTAAIKVNGSGTLQDVPAGTQVSVETTAIKMISLSDNTAADMLIKLVGRSAVETQVRKWATKPTLDIPFLTVSEAFALKYANYPTMANTYLALPSSRRAAYLASTVDAVAPSAEQSSSAPRAINQFEWFATANDLCRAFAGLMKLQAEPGLGPISTVLSTNNGGIALSATTWPRIWFKGGSENGVLTLGYLTRDSQGSSYVVIGLTNNPTKVLAPAATDQILGIDTAAINKLHPSPNQ
jgi:beta-lactamase class A